MVKSVGFPSQWQIDPALLVQAYRQGIFPMADSAQSLEVSWYQPQKRGILPLESFHLPKSLKKRVLSGYFTITVDTVFERVIALCAESTPQRAHTWINAPIQEVFCSLSQQGLAHSIEVWEGSQLCGGLYGLALGGAFFGESMFSRTRDASKVALVHLVGRMKKGGFTLLDTQFVTDHLAQFGAVEITAESYAEKLHAAIKRKADWLPQMTAKEVVEEALGLKHFLQLKDYGKST
ncbi:leucyl/phenylalanyl-tRNA--protein transferase [Entomobacter blattae]|uniref:Leucyl/phenylalanyl-tRNA--protein transferase n=1 Tax=Entomobacter blattae TaxID=2762277 RepID=A0A7H1NNI3_9PROT|nr:leucyl/phenylalanyl-tRNA--protein transferase [Entomobacter blattae]QNT77343.1 Leucyl/phenylalanyl-tRNA--protein transferase [Entomobacter blattae]